MTCCKADEFKWCAEFEADCQDEEGNNYCAFHASVGCKGGGGKEEFESRLFQRIDEAIWNESSCDLSGNVFPWGFYYSQYDKDRHPIPDPHTDFSFHSRDACAVNRDLAMLLR